MELHKPQTITDRKILSVEIEAIRRKKVGLDNEKFVAGMVAAALPITDELGRIAAILAVHVPVTRVDIEETRAQFLFLRLTTEEITS